MTIERDNWDERQTRLDRMIAEFREAQTRRYMKANDKVIDSRLDTKTTAPLTASGAPR
jgi:hypothetical protein